MTFFSVFIDDNKLSIINTRTVNDMLKKI